MSDEAVEKTGVEADISAADLTSGGVDTSVDVDSPEGNTPSPEIDLSDLKIESFAGSQPDGEEGKRNQAFAAQRIREKELKADLERIKNTPINHDADNPAPRRVDYINDDTLFDKYSGNVDMARAAYEDAHDVWERAQRVKSTDSINQKQSEIHEQQRVSTIHEDFEKHAGKYAGRVKDLDSHIIMGERNLAFRDINGQAQDGSVLIKEQFGEDAPLMIAAIGANKRIADDILSARDQFALARQLNHLQAQVRATISSNALSKAHEEIAVKGDATPNATPVERALEEAAKAGDWKEYQRLQGRDETGRPMRKK